MDQKKTGFSRYLSRLDVWALALGCIIGWGAFVMPGTTFLPIAGPAGTATAIIISTVVMGVIGINYSWLMVQHPGIGGVYVYTKSAFGRGHAFLSAWFLCLSYLALIPQNATALAVMIRALFRDRVKKGAHYSIAGYDMYLREAAIAVSVLVIVGILAILFKPFLQHVMTGLVIIMVTGVVLLSAVVLKTARRDGNRRYIRFGTAGIIISAVFGVTQLWPDLIIIETMQAESYLLLGLWCLLGFAFYWRTMRSSTGGDQENETVTVSALFVLLFYSALVWYIKKLSGKLGPGLTVSVMLKYSFLFAAMVLSGLLVMLLIASQLKKRQELLESERIRAMESSKLEGTGLGLAITKNIIDLMGGSIEVITSPGDGTEIIIRIKMQLAEDMDIPAEEEPAEVIEAEESEVTEDFSDKRLLLVEDNEINREIALMILTQAGFMVETAENGQEAVDMVSSSAPGYYDAVLMDIQMPVMDGYKATGTIRALGDKELSKIPIIAMTANVFREDEEAAKNAGMQAHIAKPFDIEKMMATISGVLKRDQGTVL